MKNLIFLFSSLVFMGLSSCSFQTHQVQHEQPDDVYWRNSDAQNKVKMLDDVKFDQNTPKKQPKQLQELSVQEEAVGVEPNANANARAEAAYQAWNQQRIAKTQQSDEATNQAPVQTLQPLGQTNSNNTPYTINNYNNYNNYNSYSRPSLRYRSRWYNASNYCYGGSYLGWNSYSGWQLGYQWPSFYQPWISPFCYQPMMGNYWGYNSFYPNYYGYYNPWYNPYYSNYYGYGNPWGGYYWPWNRVVEGKSNPSKSRPREMVGGVGKDHLDPNAGIISPGSRPFLGKKESDETIGTGSGKVNNPGQLYPNQSAIPSVAAPVQAKPYEQPQMPIQLPIDHTHQYINTIPPVSNPVSTNPNSYKDKSFRYEEPAPDGGKLIPGNNGPVYVPPRDHFSSSMPDRFIQPNSPQEISTAPIQRNQGYIPDRNQAVQQIQQPAPRNEFPSRTRERIEYQAPVPQRNSGGFGGFSNGGGGNSGNSGNRSNGSISRPR